ncbi:hypothetical protein M0R88_00560 [Halorussus gelatinilyticus]|uniref:Uncharacterized protein n=1 Tax=Halorussus gelatinilyticus TaxID=2937524 RepID=A0A8U0IHP1_9EURY|nr:hypothetical protein [Halorussus gelatinilyticus]UPW00610.1 hypothetical protein M0R88_00560 [Halorussus gelatinilyticus]
MRRREIRDGSRHAVGCRRDGEGIDRFLVMASEPEGYERRFRERNVEFVVLVRLRDRRGPRKADVSLDVEADVEQVLAVREVERVGVAAVFVLLAGVETDHFHERRR